MSIQEEEVAKPLCFSVPSVVGDGFTTEDTERHRDPEALPQALIWRSGRIEDEFEEEACSRNPGIRWCVSCGEGQQVRSCLPAAS
jgi:hypothetical protein